jgi:L-lactate dehydrogenase complex protein LldG
MSREQILNAVLKNQPPLKPLPDITPLNRSNPDVVQTYLQTFVGIGGRAFLVSDSTAINNLVQTQFEIEGKRVITSLPELTPVAEMIMPGADPHSFDDVELAIIRAPFSVAENGAVWLTETFMGQRIVPYICQHLAVVVNASSIIATMHDAYDKIAADDYGFGSFIGGPSKTADIEQALVMGAHGPITMTVFIVDDTSVM